MSDSQCDTDNIYRQIMYIRLATCRFSPSYASAYESLFNPPDGTLLVHTTHISRFFFFNDTATTEIYPLSLPGALPISSRPSIAGDDERLACDEQVRRVHQPVERALARPVSVVEQVLHLGVVDVDDGKPEGAISFHGSESDDARRGLLVGSSDTLQEFPPFRV